MGNVAMRSLGLGLVSAVVLTLMVGNPAWAVNSVVVESKSVQGGSHDVQIGIFLTNDSSVRNLIIPVTLRSISGGAFVTKMAVKRTAGGRLTGILTGINITNGYCTDPDSLVGCYPTPPIYYSLGFGKIGWADTLSHTTDTFTSGTRSVSDPPVAALYSFGILMPTEARLTPGTDGAIPSLHLLVDIGNSPGQFEIDTCCTARFNHLIYAVDSATTIARRLPLFTKGVITVPCAKGLPSPSGPTPANGALDQADSLKLTWSPASDSCGVPVSRYAVLIGTSCGSLDPVLACTTGADDCPVIDLLPNTSYFWKVRLTDFMGRSIDGPCWTFTTGSNAVQYLGGDGIPRAYSLDQNYPNPFNASTVIKFNTRHDGHVRLDVYNILGQKVITLVDEFRNFGPQAADWDGTDVVGRAVPTGLYFYRLTTADYTSVKKMVLLK